MGLEWWGEKSSVVFNSNCKLMRNAFVVVGKKKNLNYASSRDKKEQMINYDYHQNCAKKKQAMGKKRRRQTAV